MFRKLWDTQAMVYMIPLFFFSERRAFFGKFSFVMDIIAYDLQHTGQTASLHLLPNAYKLCDAVAVFNVYYTVGIIKW